MNPLEGNEMEDQPNLELFRTIIEERWSDTVKFGAIAVDPLIKMLPALGAIWALGEIGNPKAFEHLDDLVPHETSLVYGIRYITKLEKEQYQAITEALGKLGDPRAIPKLSHGLQAGHLVIRDASFKALLKMKVGSPGDLTSIVKLLPHPEASVRESAALLLLEFGWQPENQTQDIQFMFASGEIAQPESLREDAIDPLLKFIAGDDRTKREKSLNDLARLAGLELLQPILLAMRNSYKLLQDEDLGLVLVKICGRIESADLLAEKLIKVLFAEAELKSRVNVFDGKLSSDLDARVSKLLKQRADKMSKEMLYKCSTLQYSTEQTNTYIYYERGQDVWESVVCDYYSVRHVANDEIRRRLAQRL